MRRKLCPCGRKIVVNRSKGRGIRRPSDNEHDLCQKCWKALKDKSR